MTIKIKISCQGSSKSKDGKNPMIYKFLPNYGNLWRNCEFYWNDDSVTKADYWIIIGDINSSTETCLCPKENIIFMGSEPPSITRYDQIPEYINQFHRVYLSHSNVQHPRAFKCRPALNWWVDAGHPIKTDDDFQKWQGQGFGYDDFKKMDRYDKTKLISVFCSNKTFTSGHKARYNFCKTLKKHFKDKLDWFGAGVLNIANKWDGIAPYKYHIVLENGNYPDYWTEKLSDCYMAGAYPIYSGAPNINDYFDNKSLTAIDIRYPKYSIAIIEKIIAENIYEKSQNKILQSRDLVMDKYNLYNLIADIVAKDNNFGSEKHSITLKNISNFAQPVFVKEKRSLIKRISRSFNKKLQKIKFYIIDIASFYKLKLSVLNKKIA